MRTKMNSWCCIIAASITLTSQANDIPNGFIDFGDTTVQTSQQLEWLDVNLTQGRSYNDVFADITDAENQTTDKFNAAEGWRYATEEEFKNLISEWFTIEFSSYSYNGYPFGKRDEPIVESFIYTFGDTYKLFLNSKNHKFAVAPYGAGAVKGIIGNYRGSTHWRHSVALISDSELMYRGSSNFSHDNDDIVGYRETQADIKSYNHIGSFLVRKIEE